jgi:sulfopyruvate decarboxylase subunit alpha
MQQFRPDPQNYNLAELHAGRHDHVLVDQRSGLYGGERCGTSSGTLDLNEKAKDAAKRIVDELAAADIKLVASLPDDWIAELIKTLEVDNRFIHVPVNREESAVGLCSGTFFSATRSAALMGASGLMTCVYAITKINYTYEIPMLFLISLRGAMGDSAKYQVSNGLYLDALLKSINLPYEVVDSRDKLPAIRAADRHTRVINRPVVVALTRDVLRGEA